MCTRRPHSHAPFYIVMKLGALFYYNLSSARHPPTSLTVEKERQMFFFWPRHKMEWKEKLTFLVCKNHHSCFEQVNRRANRPREGRQLSASALGSTYINKNALLFQKWQEEKQLFFLNTVFLLVCLCTKGTTKDGRLWVLVLASTTWLNFIIKVTKKKN